MFKYNPIERLTESLHLVASSLVASYRICNPLINLQGKPANSIDHIEFAYVLS